MKMVSISLVPRPPLFVFFCSLVCVHYNTHKWKSGEKRGRPGISYRMHDVRWTRGGHRVPRSNNILDFIVQLSITRQGPIHSQIWQETWSQVYCTSTCSQAPPPCPPNLMHIIHVSVPRPSPFFCLSSTSVYNAMRLDIRGLIRKMSSLGLNICERIVFVDSLHSGQARYEKC